MAPLWRNKVALDAAADMESGESLSFAGLLSIQDQQPGNQDCQMTKKKKKKKQDDEEFEFSCTVGEPAGSGRLLPLFGVSISAGNGTEKTAAVDIVLICSEKKQPARSNTVEGRKAGEKKKKRRSFGGRMFRSLFSPCKECRAQNSIVKVAVS
ncbi:unnamed protein product [Linum trigynum]|uniref:Uncharacterized protein n=1 Tax=Linum trigynum TaxID=586398 RepID=A0AAV2DH47_9ROSI